MGPILFNIFINDLLPLIKECDICNFDDDNTIYACDQDISVVLNQLNNDLKNALNWFKCNFMVANLAKFQVIFLGNKDSSLGLNIDGNYVVGAHCVNLLGVTIDRKLSFLPYIKEMCTRANSKTKALLRIRNYLCTFKDKLLCNSYILSTFNYCPIICMFSNKERNMLINSIHCRALRAMLNNFSLSFEEMLEFTGDVTIHEKNLRSLALEVYKSLNEFNPSFMKEFYSSKKTSYDFRRGKLFLLPPSLGCNSWLFRSILLWNNLPEHLKELPINGFKKSLKFCKLYCKCKICKRRLLYSLSHFILY